MSRYRTAMSLGIIWAALVIGGVFALPQNARSVDNENDVSLLLTVTVTVTNHPLMTQVWSEYTQTAQAIQSSATPNMTQTYQQLQTFAVATMTNIVPTVTPYPLSTDGLIGTAAAFTSNLDAGNFHWQPLAQDFDGVRMMLVPAGCFLMGSEDGDDDERPVHDQCISEPYWIDKYEVSQSQFSQFGGVAQWNSQFEGDELPRENVNWFEARDFCALRGARLLTEVEWEYAARGRDGFNYPWGNVFNNNNAIHDTAGTHNVTSLPIGESWVGAWNMSGNVWEWVSSIYQPYPYVEGDGRENLTISDTVRVIRGGSWADNPYQLRSTFRYFVIPEYGNLTLGFRCGRDFEAS